MVIPRSNIFIISTALQVHPVLNGVVAVILAKKGYLGSNTWALGQSLQPFIQYPTSKTHGIDSAEQPSV